MPPEKAEMSDEKKFPLKVPLPEIWDEAVAAFKNDLYRCGRSESTVITYASALKAFALFYRDHLKKPGPHVALMQDLGFREVGRRLGKMGTIPVG